MSMCAVNIVCHPAYGGVTPAGYLARTHQRKGIGGSRVPDKRNEIYRAGYQLQSSAKAGIQCYQCWQSVSHSNIFLIPTRSCSI